MAGVTEMLKTSCASSAINLGSRTYRN